MHFGIKSTTNIAAKIWNQIPNEIKEAAPLQFFRNKIKKKWIQQGCLCRLYKNMSDKWVLHN